MLVSIKHKQIWMISFLICSNRTKSCLCWWSSDSVRLLLSRCWIFNKSFLRSRSRSHRRWPCCTLINHTRTCTHRKSHIDSLVAKDRAFNPALRWLFILLHMILLAVRGCLSDPILNPHWWNFHTSVFSRLISPSLILPVLRPLLYCNHITLSLSSL